MTSIFKDYAAYYDLLYHEKSYSDEVAYLDRLQKKAELASVNRILDIGCGTGRHAALLAKRGYDVTGIDPSQSMITEAKKREETGDMLSFQHATASTFSLSQPVDLAVSLFHVMSYHVTNTQIDETLRTVHAHLVKNGGFIFDFWHGNGVLHDLPSEREKTFENDHYRLVRHSTPTLNWNQNRVDVQFDMTILDKHTRQTETLQETHQMRYFFVPELVYMLENNHFEVLDIVGWMTESPISHTDWYGLVIARKKDAT